MKKTLFTVFMVIAVALTFAHPPKKLVVTYNEADGQLIIEAEHKVSNVESHYLDKITISINDVEEDVIELKKQSSPEAEKYIYDIEGVKKGDVIKVRVSCNKMGAKYAEVKVK